MAKAPAFQFYVKDWLSDPAVRACSPFTRGIWIDCLCLMWESEARGNLSGTKEQLARLFSISIAELDSFLQEANDTKLCTVTNRNKKITITNRRMDREEKSRKNNALRQKKYREKTSNAKNNAKVTPPSSSSSSLKSKSVSEDSPPPSYISPPLSVTPKKIHQDVPKEIIAGFNSCWKVYPVHHNRDGALKAWIECWQAGELDNSQIIHDRILELKEYDARWLEGKYPNMDRFIRERRWNDEPHSAPARDGPLATTVHQERQQQAAERCRLLQAIKHAGSQEEREKLFEELKNGKSDIRSNQVRGDSTGCALPNGNG